MYMEEKIFYNQIILESILASVCHQRYEDYWASFLFASQKQQKKRGTKKTLFVQTVGAALCVLREKVSPTRWFCSSCKKVYMDSFIQLNLPFEDLK